jgi:maltooligosyltrehalose trehalohydrolase
MNPHENGWWSARVDSAPEETGSAREGTDYAFILNEGEALPDPRSPWQPQGVHGPSRLLDHGAFLWTDRHWQARPLSSGVIYELHVGSFTPDGTFDSAVDRLDHLVRLGVTHVELMPVCEFPGTRGWGYDGVDLYAPHHAYGGPEGLKGLVDACHDRGLSVILDVVYNHLGPDGNYLGRFGPYFTDRYGTPWGDAVNLDGRGSDEVRAFFIDNALMWLTDYHIDGLRIDAVHAIFDASALHFLEQLASAVRNLEASLGRHLVLIAESDANDPRIVRSPEAGGYGLDAQWNEDFHHALHALLTEERKGYYCDFGSLGDLAKTLTQGFLHDGRHSGYRGRRHGRPPTGVSGHRFVGCLQNHDQVGNRARGERVGHLVSRGRSMIGAAVVLTSPFVPMLFQGEEWGASTPFPYFTDHQDPELSRAVVEGRKQEFAAFGWNPEEIPDPQAPETFLASKLNWAEVEEEPHSTLLAWYGDLIRLRREYPDLSDGRLDRVKIRYDEEGQWMIMERGALAVVFNLADGLRRVPIGQEEATTLLRSDFQIEVNEHAVELPPDSVAVLALPGAPRRKEPMPGADG